MDMSSGRRLATKNDDCVVVNISSFVCDIKHLGFIAGNKQLDIYLFMYLFIDLFIDLFIYLFIYWFIVIYVYINILIYIYV